MRALRTKTGCGGDAPNPHLVLNALNLLRDSSALFYSNPTSLFLGQEKYLSEASEDGGWGYLRAG